jgi:hypothetical protein
LPYGLAVMLRRGCLALLLVTAPATWNRGTTGAADGGNSGGITLLLAGNPLGFPAIAFT